MERSTQPKQPAKTQEELVGLSRSPTINTLKTVKDEITRSKPRYNMDGLTEENKLAWIIRNLLHVGGKNYDYPDYSQTMEDNGIYPLHSPNVKGEEKEVEKEITVALLSDWASDTFEAQRIASLAGVQDYSIHMGDTYYVGKESEIADNFDDEKGGTWPYGRIGSFAMLGNHEMYTGGVAYFTKLLEYMGLYFDQKGKPKVKQRASFFCLQNKYWKIVCIDTGYDSLLPILDVRANTRLKLNEQQMSWLKNVAFCDPADTRGVIILSHHQPFSDFGEEYPIPMKQLADLFGSDKTVLWFCGHEHRMAVYGANLADPKNPTTRIFLRCIGHGGMPVEIKKNNPKSAKWKLVLHDQRERNTLKKGRIPLGHNGYVILRLNNEKLTADYCDDSLETETNKVLSEEWAINIQTGNLSSIKITDFTQDADKKLTRVLPLDMAIGKM